MRDKPKHKVGDAVIVTYKDVNKLTTIAAVEVHPQWGPRYIMQDAFPSEWWEKEPKEEFFMEHWVLPFPEGIYEINENT